jgi:hypothetical protein
MKFDSIWQELGIKDKPKEKDEGDKHHLHHHSSHANNSKHLVWILFIIAKGRYPRDLLIIFLVRFLHRTKNLAELAYILVGVLYIAVQ